MMSILQAEKSYRPNCPHCMRPVSFCYCPLIKKIDSKIKFVILIHSIEVKRKIATGRMAHLCLTDSVLIRGSDFTNNEQVNKIINHPDYHCVLLYPGVDAINLSEPNQVAQKQTLFPKKKQLVVFVVDGTWKTAGKTLKSSENLRKLPTICFTPKAPSRFRIRKQPAPGCYSTIEAIHHIIDLLEEPNQLESGLRPHDLLITLFDRMVEQQIPFSPKKFL